MFQSVSPNLAKEVLSVIAFLDDDFVDSLPDDVISNLTFLAADANQDYVLTKGKSLLEQDISDECKEYLAFLYYQVVSPDKRNELLDAWVQNDKYNN